MSCTALENELRQLRAQRRQQVEAMTYLKGAGLQAAQEQLDRIDADIAQTQADLDLCRAREEQEQNPVPQAISGTVSRICCHRARREIGPDEPYLLIATFDMLNVINLGIVGANLPAINVVKIGPWAGVKAPNIYGTIELPVADRPAFWDLNGHPRAIARPEHVILLVAFMENDGSSPDAIRGGVRTNLLASRFNNINRPLDAYVATMKSNMVGAIETLRVEGLDPLHLNVDDLIGDVTQLVLTADDLARLNRLEPVEKSLRFTQRRRNGTAVNDYTVYFSFTV